MKIKLPTLFVVFVVTIFSLSLNFNTKALAQSVDEVTVYTTGYGVLSSTSFIFDGYYSGNYQNKAFTTYFEFAEDDSNLEVDSGDLLEYFGLLNKDKQTTIPIVRGAGADESNVFYTSQPLQLFSTYYFRAVGYFNDAPNQKFYGAVLSFRTGVIPPGASYPFNVTGDGTWVKYCERPLVLDATGNTCIAKPVCTYPKTLNFQGNTCITSPKCTLPQVRNLAGDKCISRPVCTGDDVLDFSREKCITPIKCTSPLILSYDKKSCVNRPTCSSTQYLNEAGNICIECAPQIVNSTKNGCINNPSTDNDTGVNTGTGSGAGNPDDSSDSNSSSSLSALVNCDGSDSNPCGFKQIIDLINSVIKFVFIYMVVPISAIMFAYAGIELVFSGGSVSAKEKATKKFTNVAIGLVLAASAFLIVQTILQILGYDKSINWFGF